MPQGLPHSCPIPSIPDRNLQLGRSDSWPPALQRHNHRLRLLRLARPLVGLKGGVPAAVRLRKRVGGRISPADDAPNELRSGSSMITWTERRSRHSG